MKNVLVITRWFPNKYEPVKCVFTKNILDSQAKYTKYNYTLISPIPYFPRVNLPFVSEKFRNFSKLDYREDGNGYDIYRPKYLKLPHPLTESFEWYPYLRSVLNVIKKENLQFDIIHCHGVYPDGYVSIKIGKIFGVPVVTHIHESYFRSVYEAHRQKIDQILNYSDQLIAVSVFQKNTVEAICDKCSKISVVHNGVDIDKFTTGACYRGSNVKLIFVGNLIDIKGVDILIRAFNRLKNDNNITLDIYGEGKNKEEYQNMVSELHIDHLIKFRGIVDNNIVPQILKDHSFLILPSHYETFGIVLIEAMACGIPVIASRVGPIPEIVDSHEVGILVEPANPMALAEGIEEAINREWNPQKIREHAKKFSIENTARGIEKIYDEIFGLI